MPWLQRRWGLRLCCYVFFVVYQTGNSNHRSQESTSVGDVTQCAVDSAFSLPPSRAQPTSADDDLLPVPARSRDEDRSTKPRIWSLVEVATRNDYRPKRAHRAVSAEFRPWRATDTAACESTAARVGPRQVAVISACTMPSLHGDSKTTPTTLPTELYRPTV